MERKRKDKKFPKQSPHKKEKKKSQGYERAEKFKDKRLKDEYKTRTIVKHFSGLCENPYTSLAMGYFSENMSVYMCSRNIYTEYRPRPIQSSTDTSLLMTDMKSCTENTSMIYDAALLNLERRRKMQRRNE